MASPPGTAPTLTWGALGIVYVVWGSTYLGIRYVVESVPPLLSGATRFASAAVLLAVVLVVRHGFSALRVTRREVAGAAAVGVLLLGGGNGLVVLAESPGIAVASGIAALLIATVPLLVVLLRAALGERPRPATIVGVILGLVGLALLVLPAGGVPAAPLARRDPPGRRRAELGGRVRAVGTGRAAEEPVRGHPCRRCSPGPPRWRASGWRAARRGGSTSAT